jgi:hypothetical protein
LTLERAPDLFVFGDALWTMSFSNLSHSDAVDEGPIL